MPDAFKSFGLSNNPEEYKAAVLFREAAIKDGWNHEPTFPTEPESRHATLERDGFKCHILTRRNVGSFRYRAEVSIWGPDGLAITPPKVYDWDKIKAGIKRCNYCKKDNVPTQRVGFTGRCCDKCLPSIQKKVEYPGWTN
jgi:hypothetical protein